MGDVPWRIDAYRATFHHAIVAYSGDERTWPWTSMAVPRQPKHLILHPFSGVGRRAMRLDGRTVDHHVLWPMRLQPSWWVLTDYPSVNDQMTILDGATFLAYTMATAIAIGASVSLFLWLAARSLGSSPGAKFHHFAQSLISVASCGVFLGLSAITVTMLRAEGLARGFVGPLRAALLGGAAVWSIVLAWKIAGLSGARILRRCTATFCVALGRRDRNLELGPFFLGVAISQTLIPQASALLRR